MEKRRERKRRERGETQGFREKKLKPVFFGGAEEDSLEVGLDGEMGAGFGLITMPLSPADSRPSIMLLGSSSLNVADRGRTCCFPISILRIQSYH